MSAPRPVQVADTVALTLARINAGLSRRQLADKAQTDARVISRVEDTGYVPSPAVQKRIADVFGKAPTDLWPIRPAEPNDDKVAA